MEQPVVSPLFMLVRSFTKGVCFQCLCSAAGNCLPQGTRVNPELQNLCAWVALLPMETSVSLEGGNSERGKAEDNPINWASALFEGVLLHEQQPLKNCTGLQYFIII